MSDAGVPEPSSEEALSSLRELEAALRGMSARQFDEIVRQEVCDNLELLRSVAKLFEGRALVDVALWSVSFVMHVRGSLADVPVELRRVLATVLRRAAEVVEGRVDPLAGGGN